MRERILAAAISVVQAGDEPTMRSLARAATASERIIHRYFASRDARYLGLVPTFRQRATAPLPATPGEVTSLGPVGLETV